MKEDKIKDKCYRQTSYILFTLLRKSILKQKAMNGRKLFYVSSKDHRNGFKNYYHLFATKDLSNFPTYCFLCLIILVLKS